MIYAIDKITYTHRQNNIKHTVYRHGNGLFLYKDLVFKNVIDWIDYIDDEEVYKEVERILKLL